MYFGMHDPVRDSILFKPRRSGGIILSLQMEAGSLVHFPMKALQSGALTAVKSSFAYTTRSLPEICGFHQTARVCTYTRVFGSASMIHGPISLSRPKSCLHR